MNARRRRGREAGPERERAPPREAPSEEHGPDWEPSGPEWAPPSPSPAKPGDPPLEHPVGERSRHGGRLPAEE